MKPIFESKTLIYPEKKEKLYDEIHDWMNVGLSSLAMQRTEVDRFIENIQFYLRSDLSDNDMANLRRKLFRYTRVEDSQWWTAKELTSGVKIGSNTRILEIKNKKGEPQLVIGNSYMEFNRIANYHGYWDKESAQKLVEYLTGWLRKVDAGS